MTDTAFQRIVTALEQHGSRVTGSGARRKAQCPAHDDRNPSLSVTGIEGQALLHCFTGCDYVDVLTALNLDKADLYDTRRGVDYRYSDGRIVHRKLNKTFPQSGNRTGNALYRADKLRAAVAAGQTVWVTEGEKDTHALEALGAVATCSAMGAGKAPLADWSPLSGGTVRIIADKDNPGRAHARDVRTILTALSCEVSMWTAKVGKDAADHVAAGHGLDEFEPITEYPPLVPGQQGEWRSDGEWYPDHPGETESTRRLEFRRASTITPRPVHWLWDTAQRDAGPAERQGRFPIGSLCLEVGRAGIGKSQFACWMTARVSTGTLPGASYGIPRGVVYAASEDSWEMTIVPRLIAAGADLDRVFHVSVVDDEDLHARLTLPVDTALLEAGITEHDVVLVVMDPLLSMIDADINDYRAREVRLALEPLCAVADRTRATFLGVAHFTKGTGTDPLLLVSGSAAFGQVVRAAVAFARDDNDAETDTYVLSTIKNNLGRENLPSLAYTITPHSVSTPDGDTWVSRFDFTGEESERSVRDLLRASPQEEDEDGEDIRGWLHAYLARNGGTAAPEDMTKAGRAAGYSPDQLKRAKKPKGAYPKIHSRKTAFGDGWVWTLESDTDSDREGGSRGPGLSEGSTKGAKGAVHTDMLPSLPSLPSSSPGVTHGDTDQPAEPSRCCERRPPGPHCAHCPLAPSLREAS